jgi:putative endonuclease
MDEDKKWFVYILECMDGSYYTGVTNNIKKRMVAHKSSKGSKYVVSKGFSRLISFKACSNKSEALKLEYKIKQLPKNEKLYFLKS